MADTSLSVESIIQALDEEWNSFIHSKLQNNHTEHDPKIHPETYFEEFRERYIVNVDLPWCERIENPTTENDHVLRDAVYEHFDYLKELYIFRYAMPAAEARLRSAIARIRENVTLVLSGYPNDIKLETDYMISYN